MYRDWDGVSCETSNVVSSGWEWNGCTGDELKMCSGSYYTYDPCYWERDKYSSYLSESNPASSISVLNAYGGYYYA
jgi:hypothetical protein